VGHFISHRVQKLLRQLPNVPLVVGHLDFGQTTSFAKADHEARSERSRAETLFLTASAHLTVKSDAGLAANIKGTNTFWTLQFVATNRQQINVALINIDRYFSDSLSRVRVEEHFVFSAYFANLFDGLNRANLIVHVNDRTEERIRSDCLFQRLQTDQPVCLHWQISHLKALILQFAARIKDALMVDLRRDDVLFLVPVKRRNPLYAQVV